MTDSRAPGTVLFAHDGSVFVEADLASMGFEGKRYVSVPVRTVMPFPIDLSPSQIAPSFDRRWRECTVPSATESAYVEFFFGNAGVDLSQRYTICGRTSYAAFAGNELIHADDLYLANSFDTPSADQIVDVADLGERGQIIVDQLIAELAGGS